MISSQGVLDVTVIGAQRVEKGFFCSSRLHHENIHKLCLSGLVQGQDVWLPTVRLRKLFKPFVEDELTQLFEGSVKLLAHPGNYTHLCDVDIPKEATGVVVAIGPEGGWNDFEVDLLCSYGFQKVCMGKKTLRVDTACVVAIALACDVWRRANTGCERWVVSSHH